MSLNMVRVISTSIVHAQSETIDPDHDDDRRVELTPWDLQLLLIGPMQQGFLFPKPQNMTSSLIISHLQTSLSQTLSFFPPLAGRLSRTDNDDGATASFSIVLNNAGAQFDHAEAGDVLVSDILGADSVPRIVSSFFPLNGTKNYEGVARPLLAVRVTELADGVFVGCTVNHVVADGSSLWHFLRSWSEVARGMVTISKPPVVERWFVGGGERPVRIPLAQLDKVKVGFRADDRPPRFLERIYRFDKERMAELKAEANSEMDTDRISSLQALLAHFWRCYVRAAQPALEHEDDVYFGLGVGVRSRVKQPPLPEEYLGNAVQVGRVKLKAGEVVQHGIGHTAWEINKTIGLHSQEMIRSMLKSWSDNPMLLTLSTSTSSSRNIAMGATNSPRFNLYDTDFGWGRPVAVRNGTANKYAGKLVLYPNSLQDGGVEVHICLLPETFDALHKDSQFIDKLSV